MGLVEAGAEIDRCLLADGATVTAGIRLYRTLKTGRRGGFSGQSPVVTPWWSRASWENQICIPWREARLSVRPGITGLWQMCRDRRTAADFHQWIYYDMTYVLHASPWVDLKILIATALTLGGRRPVPVSRLIPGTVPGQAPEA